MSKPGDEYQELVGSVARVLDPGASVRVGQRIDGPDGQRDMDVEVRGTIDGAPWFVLIECKDWSRRIGVGVVDALHSKKDDLCADRAVIYSNSGFTSQALRKAARLGIGMASALKAGDSSVQVVLETVFVARVLSAVRVNAVVAFDDEAGAPLPIEWKLEQLLFVGRPLRNWISKLSGTLISAGARPPGVRFQCALQADDGWTYDDRAIAVRGLDLEFQVDESWASQTVRQDVTLGAFDYIHRHVTVPSNQSYVLGTFDNQAWEPCEAPDPGDAELPPNSFSVEATLVSALPPFDGSGSPAIDALIIESATSQLPSGDGQ